MLALYRKSRGDLCPNVSGALHTQNIAFLPCFRHKPDTSGRLNTVLPNNRTLIMPIIPIMPLMHNLLEAPLALLAGVLTIASPCILPVMPILLGTSVERPSRVRPLFIVAGFILTFASFAMLLGAVSSQIHVAQEALRNTAIVMLALSGLLRLWPQPYEWLVARLQQPLQRIGAAAAAAMAATVPATSGVKTGGVISHGQENGANNSNPNSNASGFVLGMSLGAIWTPCAGPVLASILVLVVKAQDLGWSALLLTLYAIGAAIPMLAIIYGGQFITQRVRVVARHAQRLQQVFGVLVILTALAIYLQYDVLVIAKVAAFFPSLKGL
jgi:cytochrome c-type biogenesis protein